MCIHDQHAVYIYIYIYIYVYIYVCIQSLMQDLDLGDDINEWMYKVVETSRKSKNITDI